MKKIYILEGLLEVIIEVILEVEAATAAAARVEVERRNNFGCAADYLRLRGKNKL